MNFPGIYLILNKVNNKCYVGSATYIGSRWRTHLAYLRSDRHHNRYLQSAWNKHGEENFEFKILEVCHTADLINREQYYIDEYKACDREVGYNLCPVAGSNAGTVHTEETKAKWSVTRKGKPRSEAAKAAIKAGWEKRRAAGPVSEETKRRQSEAHKGNKHSEETLAKMSESKKGNTINNGRKQTEEHIENRASKLRGRSYTEEHRAAISEGQKGHNVSEETRQKMSEAAKARGSNFH